MPFGFSLMRSQVLYQAARVLQGNLTVTRKVLLYAMPGFGSWRASRLQIPDQILDPVEKQHSIFVDRNNQYDLKEAREAEQASLQLNEADQVKFGKAFIRFPKVLQLLPLELPFAWCPVPCDALHTALPIVCCLSPIAVQGSLM